MRCSRCRNEIVETCVTHYECCGEKRFRHRLKYAKILLKPPEVTSDKRNKQIYLCDKCYDDFLAYFDDRSGYTSKIKEVSE